MKAKVHCLRPTAFTLVELMVVMVVAVIIMSVSLPAFISMGRGASMRTAVSNVSSTLALARQWAITHRKEITFVASMDTNDNACYHVVDLVDGIFIQTNVALPLDVKFGVSSVTNLTFKTDGGLTSGAGTEVIMLVDKNTSIEKTIHINGLTGGIKVGD